VNLNKAMIGLALVGAWGTAAASGVTAAGLEEVVVNAERIPLTGRTVLREQLEHRPLLQDCFCQPDHCRQPDSSSNQSIATDHRRFRIRGCGDSGSRHWAQSDGKYCRQIKVQQYHSGH
jgi:hypothetical protein